MALPIDMTDTEGRFRLPGVPPDQWRVVGESDEFVESETDAFRTEVGKTQDMKLTMLTPGKIVGRVLGDGGRYLPGANVRFGHLEDGDLTRAMSGWEADRFLEPGGVTTDEDGNFTLEGLRPGPGLLRVEADGYITVYRRNLVVEAGAVINTSVSVDRGSVISGIVRGADGLPIPGARVTITRNPDPQMPWRRGADDEDEEQEEGEVEPRLTARTGDDGRFEILNVPDGTWNAYVAMATGHVGYWVDAPGKENAIIRNVRAPGEPLNFSLSAAEEGADNPFAGMGRGGNRGGR